MAPTRWLDERQSHLWRSWLRLNQELPGLLAELLNRESGLSVADYAVLVPLSESPDGRLRARDLRREILWDRSRLSHHLGRMEKRGLVVREECAEDGRGEPVPCPPCRSPSRARARRISIPLTRPRPA